LNSPTMTCRQLSVVSSLAATSLPLRR